MAVECPCADCKHLYVRRGPTPEYRPTCILRCRCHGWEVYSPSGRVEPEHEAAMRDMTCGAFARQYTAEAREGKG